MPSSGTVRLLNTLAGIYHTRPNAAIVEVRRRYKKLASSGWGTVGLVAGNWHLALRYRYGS